MSAVEGRGRHFYRCQGDPLDNSWVRWTLEDRTRFNGQYGELLSRREGDVAVVRMQPHAGLANVMGGLHGGAIMGFVDVALFLGGRMFGIPSAADAATVDLNVQFARAADVEQLVDARIELTRETGRFMFLRGTVDQGGATIATFISLLRKSA